MEVDSGDKTVAQTLDDEKTKRQNLQSWDFEAGADGLGGGDGLGGEEGGDMDGSDVDENDVLNIGEVNLDELSEEVDEF